MKLRGLTKIVAVIAICTFAICAVFNASPIRGEQKSAVETLQRRALVNANGSTSDSESTKSTEQPKTVRDPFATTDAMHDLADQAIPVVEQTKVAPVARVKLPALRVRGFMDDGIRPPLVLLEVEGEDVYLVRQGDRLHVPAKSDVIELHVQEITNLGVRVEIYGLGHMMVPR